MVTAFRPSLVVDATLAPGNVVTPHRRQRRSVSAGPGHAGRRTGKTTAYRLTSTINAIPAAAATLTVRDRALLRAVAAGRCDLVVGAAPEFRVDGRWYCDQSRAHDLIAAGLLSALRASGRERGPAELTMAGRRALVH